MKKYLFIIAAAATCLLVACSKEKELRAPEEETVAPVEHLPGWTYIGATSIEESKASLTDDATPAFQWNAGDKIAVYSGDTYAISAALSSGGSASAEFAFQGSIDAGRKYFAVYPASLVHDGTSVISGCDSPSDNSLTVNLPSTYSISEVKDLASPVPMVAVNTTDQALAFKSVCALVRFSLTNVPKQTKAITFGFNGKKVHGLFNITGIDRDDPDAMLGVQAAAAAAPEDTVITVNGISLEALQQNYVVNIPVPAGGEYKNVTITTLDNEGHKINSYRSKVRSAGNWAPTRKGRRKLSVTLPVFTAQGTSTSFNAGIKVVFAPGNLRATLAKVPASSKPGYASEWAFAPHQYDTIATFKNGRTYPINSFNNSEVGDVIDLFAWCGADATGFTGTYEDDKYKYGIINPSGSGTYVGSASSGTIMKDWGTLNISDGSGGYYASGTWRLPTRHTSGSSTVEEWKTLTNGRDGTYKCTKATINSNDGLTLIARGVILFPDGYVQPSGLPAVVNKASGHSANAHFTDNTFTLAQWERMEAIGCAFLPVTNYRTSSRTMPYFADSAYWADYALNSANAGGLYFVDLALWSVNNNKDNNGMSTNKYIGKNGGAAVRLLRTVN